MFQWKEEYSVDGCVIDHEHQHLFELANRILAIKDPAKQVDVVKEAIRNVYDYIEYHFSHEEELMREVEYPEYEQHAQKHQDLRNKMNMIPCTCYDIKHFVVEFKQFMAKWVLHHIIEEDTKIAPYLKTPVGASAKCEVQ